MLAVSICSTLSYLAENHVGQDKGGLLLRHRDAWESVLHHARRPDWEKAMGFTEQGAMLTMWVWINTY